MYSEPLPCFPINITSQRDFGKPVQKHENHNNIFTS